MTAVRNDYLSEARGLATNSVSEIIFLDFQATTPLDTKVLEAMLPWLRGAYNAHATEHDIGRAAYDAVEEAREKVATLLGCQHSEIIFTSGATEASNIILRGVTDAGDELAISAIEHASVMETVKCLASQGRGVHLVGVTNDGILDLDKFESALSSHPTLVSIMWVNNEIGTIQPIEEVAVLCAESGSMFHCDMTQAVGRIPQSLNDLSVDYASISSHKIYGPQGIGALFIKNGARKPNPIFSGGGQEDGIRSGTLPVASCVGFGVACELAATHCNKDFEHAKNLSLLMLDALSNLEGWQVNGSLEERIPHNLSIAFDRVDAQVLLASITELALSTGSACSSGSLKESETLKAIGLSDELSNGTIRIGFGRTTTFDEIKIAADLLCQRVVSLRNAVA